MGRIFDFLFGDTAPDMGMQANEVHINPPPNSLGTKERHLRRIIACLDAAGRPGLSTARRESFAAEVQRRRGALLMVGIDLPPDIEAAKRMLETLGVDHGGA